MALALAAWFDGASSLPEDLPALEVAHCFLGQARHRQPLQHWKESVTLRSGPRPLFNIKLNVLSRPEKFYNLFRNYHRV